MSMLCKIEGGREGGREGGATNRSRNFCMSSMD